MAERRQGREGSYLSTQTALTVQILWNGYCTIHSISLKIQGEQKVDNSLSNNASLHYLTSKAF